MAPALGHTGSVAATHGLSSWGSQALEHRLSRRGAYGEGQAKTDHVERCEEASLKDWNEGATNQGMLAAKEKARSRFFPRASRGEHGPADT